MPVMWVRKRRTAGGTAGELPCVAGQFEWWGFSQRCRTVNVVPRSVLFTYEHDRRTHTLHTVWRVGQCGPTTGALAVALAVREVLWES